MGRRMSNKIIIFGSGEVGYDALAFFGAERIYSFCDNNSSLAGTEKYGKTVISFTDLKENYRQAIVMIAVAGSDTYKIAEQCEENGILDYLIYRQLREAFPESDGTELLHFISDPRNRMGARKEVYYRRASQLKRQVDYFKSHADIRHMKPAAGGLRYRQEQCVQVSISFFKKIEELGIKPILYGGNLLGHVRHNGFIPWDDDIDFALIRGEYERLKEYCRQHVYTEKEWHKRSDIHEKDILPGLDRYYWYLWHDHFSVVEVREDGYMVGMDFFSLEYYADHYSLAQLMELSARLREEVVCKNSEEEKIQCVNEALEKNKENTAQLSDHIYYGLDNMELQMVRHNEGFMPRDVIYPLRQVIWEGESFWVPNDAEKFLAYEYERPWDFPDDVGIPLHQKMSQGEM